MKIMLQSVDLVKDKKAIHLHKVLCEKRGELMSSLAVNVHSSPAFIL